MSNSPVKCINTIEDNIYQFGFHIIDDFLEPSHFQRLRAMAESFYEAGQFRNAKVGRLQSAVRNDSIRTDEICWLEENQTNPAVAAYLAKINEIKLTLNRMLFLGLADFETHFAIYQPGTFYKKHVDQFSTTQDRRISCVYYLNDHWESAFSGELMLYDKHDNRLANILPFGNRFVCFSSDLPHEVCETKKIRYSLTGWIKTRGTR
ncbi:2OG-Fe(II) oxygenase [Legionella hackeliae]|nr:2OG-Fe(II) oxygenase [Legionella hackeliae]